LNSIVRKELLLWRGSMLDANDHRGTRLALALRPEAL
jgi:hypothetical protein